MTINRQIGRNESREVRRSGSGGIVLPAARSDIQQWLIDSDFTDKVSPQLVDTPKVPGVNTATFTGAGGITDSRVSATDTVLLFVGNGTEPVPASGSVNCAADTELAELKLGGSNIWYVASAGEGSGVYDVNANDLFANIEMAEGFEMKDYLEVLV